MKKKVSIAWQKNISRSMVWSWICWIDWCSLLGEETVSRKEFAEILDAGFGEIQVGVIPAVVDRVVVGDITRTRLAGIRVLFFAGVNEGIVPSGKSGGNILTDRGTSASSDLSDGTGTDCQRRRIYAAVLSVSADDQAFGQADLVFCLHLPVPEKARDLPV